jgi:Coenzyme PQQ synthesis protein D (PqqD)
VDGVPQPQPGLVAVPRLDVQARRRDGVLHVGLDGVTFELSESAGLIWRRMDGRRTVAELAELLAQEYEIDRETALADVTETLLQLAAGGLLSFRPAG